MPNIKSAKKKMRQDIKRTAQNDKYAKSMKDIMKDLTKSKGAKDVQDKVKKAYSTIDKAAKKNLIHKNKAARLKGKVSRLVK